jgi:hypothetical protein
MDKKSVKAALGRRRLESQHIGDTRPESNSDTHTDLGSSGGQPTNSSGGAMVSISVRPIGVDAESNSQASASEKLANAPYSAVKQPKQDKSGVDNQGSKASDGMANGMHQVVNGESGDFNQASPKAQQGPNKALFAKVLNEGGISPMRRAIGKRSKQDESNEGNV